MHNKPVILLTVLAAAIALGFLLYSRRPPEPTYGGLPLTVWLTRLPEPPYKTVETNESVRAIRSMGTNALPHLLHLLSRKDSPMTRLLKVINAKQSLVRFRVTDASMLGDYAGCGLVALGDTGRPAIPDLARLLHDPEHVGNVACFFPFFGPEGFRTLATGLTNRNEYVRWMSAVNLTLWAARVLTNANNEAVLRFQREARVAVPALVAALRDANPRVVHAVATALGAIRQEPDLVIPALTAVVQDSGTSDSARKAASKSLELFRASDALNRSEQ